MNIFESRIAVFVENHSRKMGYPPTVEELIQRFGIVIVMFALPYVINLYRIGMIRNSLFFGTGDLKLIPVRSR